MKVVVFVRCLLAMLLLLHQPVAALNWQGTGNFSNSNLTVIWTYIEQNFVAKYNAGGIDAFNLALSDHLNDLWSPAWNVATILMPNSFLTPYVDTLVYGYAFRNHWMWYNGYTNTSPALSTLTFTFVIWKDYNCQGWRSVGMYTMYNGIKTSFSSSQLTFINGIINSLSANLLLTDPWTLAKSILDQVQGSTLFVTDDNHAYSIVLSQGFNGNTFYGRMCVVGNNFFFSQNDGPNPQLLTYQGVKYGTFVLFQTR